MMPDVVFVELETENGYRGSQIGLEKTSEGESGDGLCSCGS